MDIIMLNASTSQIGFEFELPTEPGFGNFASFLSDFNRIGRKTEIFERNGLTYFVNDYWTSAQRQSNRLHEISYRACFKAELPAFFIKQLTNPNDVVYDPFMGRGTTPLQAALMGRRPIGNDVNPLSKMLVEPRLAPPTLTQIAQRLEEVEWNKVREIDSKLLVFYHPKTLHYLTALKHWLQERATISAELDKIDSWIRMVALNRLTGHSSGFFSVYTLPPNQAVTRERQIKINQKRNQTPPLRNVKDIILKKSQSLLSQVENFACEDALIGTGLADRTNFIKDASVDLTVTSPPFLDVVQYAQDNWLRCWFANIKADEVPFSMCKSVGTWTDFTRRTLAELARITKSGGHVAYEVGEVRNGKILLEKHVVEAAKNVPFDVLGVVVNQQNFTKTANCWGVKNNRQGTNSNRIVLMRRR